LPVLHVVDLLRARSATRLTALLLTMCVARGAGSVMGAFTEGGVRLVATVAPAVCLAAGRARPVDRR